ncbi:MAG: hypothetical protein HRU38_07450 [Saccharospirillaceae bacterium]|nr:hypothetical protein [Pseudomonadales bacterium]NRB78487.1 hypothetical protein [Saccharospirillaceae bacterium]
MRYDIFFRGQIVNNIDINQVKANVKALFNASDAKLEQLFSGAPVSIKADVDQATAMKYKGAMQNAGAIAMVVSKEQPQSVPVTPAAAEQPVAAKPIQSTPVKAKPLNDDYLEQPIEVRENYDELVGSLSSVTVAQVGLGYLSEAIVIEDLTFDFSSWSIANTGSKLDTKEEVKPPAPPDTSHITLR